MLLKIYHRVQMVKQKQHMDINGNMSKIIAIQIMKFGNLLLLMGEKIKIIISQIMVELKIKIEY